MRWPWQSERKVPNTLWWRFVLWLGRMWRRYWPWYVSTEDRLVEQMAKSIGEDIDQSIINELASPFDKA